MTHWNLISRGPALVFTGVLCVHGDVRRFGSIIPRTGRDQFEESSAVHSPSFQEVSSLAD